jgi:hypothetical protein
MPLEDYQKLPREKDNLSEVATQEALAVGGPETSDVAFKPLEFGDVPMPKTTPDEESFLDKRDLSPGFVSDIRQAIAGQSGQNVNPFALGETPRQVLDKAVAQGYISPSFEPEEYMGAITPYWNAYKSSKDDGFFASVGRGTKSAIGATIGGIAGGALGSAIPLPGMALAGSVGGSIKGAELQDEFFPPTDEERAQIAFDYNLPSTKLGRMIGEFLPSFATNKLGIESGANLIKGALLSAGIDLGVAAKQVYQGAELKPQEFAERLAFDVATSMLTKPNRVGRYMFNREYRKDMAAMDRSKSFLKSALGAEEGAPTTAIAEQAAAAIEGAIPLTEGGVNLGSGNMSDVAGLIALQSALERRNIGLMDSLQKTQAKIVANLEETTKQTGATPEYTQLKFDGQNQQLLSEAAAIRDAAIAEGNAQGAAILDNAFAEAAKIRSGAINRVSDADVASNELVKVLNDATSEFAQYSGIQTKETASNAARTRFEANEKLSSTIASAAYGKIKEEGKSVLTDFSSTYRAAKYAEKEFRGRAARLAEANLDPAISRLLVAYAPFLNGKRRLYSINNLVKELADINAAIRKAKADTMPYAALNKVKAGMEQDLYKLGQKSQIARTAINYYKKHKSIYSNEGAMGALDKPPSEFLDHFLNKQRPEDYRQLRTAFADPSTGEISPAVFDEIATWQLNKLVDKFGVTPKPQSLADWYKNNDLSTLFEVFPEVQPKISRIIDNISAAQKNVDDALNVKETSERQQKIAFDYADLRIKEAQANAERISSGAAKSAQTTFDEFAKNLQDTAVNRFLGPTPVTAIDNIFTNKSRDPVKEFAALMRATQGDPQALQGLRNALREYIARDTRKFASVVAGKQLDANAEIDTKDLQLSIGKLNKDLLPNSDLRRVMDMAFDPKEVLALKTAREQARALLRKTSLTQGESSTAFNTLQDIVLGEGLSGNAMSVLFRFARGVDPSRRSAVTAGTESLVNLVRKLWKGDVKKRTEELLVDFVSNPDVAVEMLRTLDQKSKPRVEAFLKAWTSAQGMEQVVKPLPFAPQNVFEEDLKNGTVTTDFKYGFKIVKTQQKKYILVDSKGDRVGIYSSPTEAEQKAINQHMADIMKTK